MPIPLPQSAKKPLQDKAYGHVMTFGAEGKPQVTMVWMDADGDEVLFNTAEGHCRMDRSLGSARTSLRSRPMSRTSS